MSDFVDLTGRNPEMISIENNVSLPQVQHKSDALSYDLLQVQLAEAGKLVDDIVLKNYLTKLTELEIIPL